MRLLFTGGPVDYEGEFIKLDNAYCRPTPVQEPAPPIVVGAARPMMLDLVGRKADVWNCPSGLIPRLEEVRERVLTAAAGRPIRRGTRDFGLRCPAAGRYLRPGFFRPTWIAPETGRYCGERCCG